MQDSVDSMRRTNCRTVQQVDNKSNSGDCALLVDTARGRVVSRRNGRRVLVGRRSLMELSMFVPLCVPLTRAGRIEVLTYSIVTSFRCFCLQIYVVL